MGNGIDIEDTSWIEEILRKHDKDIIRITVHPTYNIHIDIWKQLPNHAVRILEQAGYTKYDRNTDSIVFVEK